MFRAGTVTGKAPFSRSVGERMGEKLVKDLGAKPDACWLFCSPSNGFRDLVEGAFRAVGTKSFIGCTTDGEISSAGFGTKSAVMAGISTDQIRFSVASVSNIGRDGNSAGQQLARALPGTARHVQVLSDGLTGNGSAIARGMTSVFGPQVPISGGAAGDDGEFKRTWQFIGGEILSDAAVAMAMTGNMSIGTGVRSGWFPAGDPKKVTRAQGNVVYELDGVSALSVYRKYLGPIMDGPAAVLVRFPFGILDQSMRLGQDPVLRAPMGWNQQDGSVSFAGEIPEGSTVTLTTGAVDENLLEASSEASRRAVSDLGYGKPGMAFLYSCMARKMLLGYRTREEISRISSVVGKEVPLIGFYTYGEYCPTRRDSGCHLHNETATVTILGLPSRAY